MKLGIYTSADERQKTRPWVYPPSIDDEDGEVIFHLRPWTRTTQGDIERRARGKNIEVMNIDEALKGVGLKDKKAEAYTRELADYLIDDWQGVVFANEHYDRDTDTHYQPRDPMPCETKYKVLLFENIDIAVDIVMAAKSFATVQLTDEAKNSVRSSGGIESRENSLSQTSA